MDYSKIDRKILANRLNWAERILEIILEEAETLEEAKENALLYFTAIRDNIIQ